MRTSVIAAIEQHQLIAILRGVENDKLINLTEALFRGGIRLVEIPYSANGTVPDTVIAEGIAQLSRHFAGRMYIGAGTVLTEEQVRLTKEAGGTFVISPDVNPSVIRATREQEMVSIPGALTPSEITAAHRAGADFIKLFPAGQMGTDYVRAIRAPLSHVKLLAVGGISDRNLKDYQKVGVCGFGVGAGFTDPTLLATGDYAAIETLARRYTEVIRHG